MRIIWQTVRRISNEILGVKELSSAILFFSSLKIISLVLNLYLTYINLPFASFQIIFII